MKRGTMMLSAFAVVLALALPCWAQVRELPTQTTTISGTIETIDQSKRVLNIKTGDGKFVALSVPDSVTRFNELKVGDKVKATYNNNVWAVPAAPDLNTKANYRESHRQSLA